MDLSKSDVTNEGADAVRSSAEEIQSVLTNPDEHPVKRWVLLDASRWTVVAVLLFAVALTLTMVGSVWSVEVARLLSETNTVQTLFNTLLSGIILLVSIVVSINSIVLSEELGSIGNQRERINESLRFRKDIEEMIDANVSPAKPAAFLRIIIETIQSDAIQFRKLTERSNDEQFIDEVDKVVGNIIQDTDQADDILEGATFGTFDVLKVGLDYNYSWQIYAIRHLQTNYADTLSDEENEAIDDLLDTLSFFATGREYFKSLYFKRELSDLSSGLLYVSLPTILYTSYVLLALDANLLPDVSILGISPLLVYVSMAYTIALAPFVVLTSFVLRAATVAKRTVASGPFILQHNGTQKLPDWED